MERSKQRKWQYETVQARMSEDLWSWKKDLLRWRIYLSYIYTGSNFWFEWIGPLRVIRKDKSLVWRPPWFWWNDWLFVDVQPVTLKRELKNQYFGCSVEF